MKRRSKGLFDFACAARYARNWIEFHVRFLLLGFSFPVLRSTRCILPPARNFSGSI
jgi:hypothetical protein